MTPGRVVLLVIVLCGIGSQTARAHHWISAEFDVRARITVRGVLVKVEWLNPHIRYTVSARKPDGRLVLWSFLGGAPGQLMRQGVDKAQLVVGAAVTVEGFQGRDGAHVGFGGAVTYDDGRRVLTAVTGTGQAVIDR